MTQATGAVAVAEPMSFTQPLLLPTPVPDHLRNACSLANRAAFEDLPERASCIRTSHALAHYLNRNGFHAELVRVEAGVFPPRDISARCVVLGARHQGPARPGWWKGHLAVRCGDYLLDPTIDQVNDRLPGAPSPMPPGIVLPLPADWGPQRAVFYRDEAGTMLRYREFERQNGWRSAPNARPSHWRRIVARMHREL